MALKCLFSVDSLMSNSLSSCFWDGSMSARLGTSLCSTSRMVCTCQFFPLPRCWGKCMVESITGAGTCLDKDEKPDSRVLSLKMKLCIGNTELFLHWIHNKIIPHLRKFPRDRFPV